MSSVIKSLFGGTDRSSQQAQMQSNADTLGFIKQQGRQSRGDSIALGQAGFENRNLGNQAALDVLAQTIPQQFDAFSQGNTGAQSTLLAGLPQINNAILGLPVDMSGLQPQRINYDTGFANQQLPNFVNPDLQAQQPQQPYFDISQLLAGFGR